MPQGQSTIDRDWAEIERAQKAAIDSDWADIQAGQNAAAPPDGGLAKKVEHNFLEGFISMPHAVLRGVEMAGGAVRSMPAWLNPLFSDKSPISLNRLLDPYVSVPVESPHEFATNVAGPLSPEGHQGVAATAAQVAGGMAMLPVTGPAAFAPMAIGQSGVDRYDEAKAAGLSEVDAWKTAVAHAVATGAMFELMGSAPLEALTKLNVKSGGTLSTILRRGAAAGVEGGKAAVATTAGVGLSKWLDKNAGIADLQKIAGSDSTKREALTNGVVGFLMGLMHAPPAGLQGPLPGETPLVGLEGTKAVQTEAPPVEPQAAATTEPTPRPSERAPVEPAKAEAVDPFQRAAWDLSDVQSKLTALEARNRGKRAPLEDIQERTRLIGETQKIALRMQEIAAGRRGPEEPKAVEAVPTEPTTPTPEPTSPTEPPPDADFMRALGDPSYRAELESMAKQAGGTAPGGHPSTDPVTGERITNRAAGFTDWWDARPGGMSKQEIQRMVAKLSKAPEGTVPDFTQRQLTMLEYMLHNTAESRSRAGEGRAAAEQMFQEQAAQERAAETDRLREEFVAANPGKEVPEGLLPESATSFDPGTWEADLHEAIVLKGEKPNVAEHYVRSVQAVSEALGEPPGPPRPPAPPESIPAPLDDVGPGSGRARIDRWIGEKQLAHANADRKSGLWRKALDKTLEPSIGRFLKERFSARSQRARSLIEEAGQLDIDLRGKLEDEYAKFGNALTDEQRAVLERAKNMTPEQRAVVDEVIANNRDISERALSENIISNYYDIYTKRIWKGNQVAGETPNTPRGPAKFTTFTTGALPRSYSSIMEGWSVGNELNVKSFVEAAAWNEKTIADVSANRNLIEDGRKAGWLRTASPGEGWEQIEHPNFRDEVLRAKISSPDSAETLRDALSGHLEEEIPLDEAVKVYGRAKEGKTSIVAGRDMRIIPRGDDILVFQKMPLFAPKEDARIINNVLGRSGITKAIEQGGLASKALGALDKFSVIAKTMRTAGINDNIIFLAMRNFGADPRGPLKAAADLVTLAPYRRGTKMIEMWNQDVQQLISVGGLRITPTADMQPFFELQKGTLSKKLESMKIVGPEARFVSNTYVDAQNFLYGKFTPAFKVNLAMLELMRLRKVNRAGLMSGTITDAALMKAAAQLSDNVLGGQNWQRMGVNPTKMHMAQLAFLAPDRMTSNIRIAADAFRSGATGAAHRALWARMSSRYIFLWAASNMAMAAMSDDKEPFRERMAKNFRLGFREGFGLDVGPALARVGRQNPSRLFVQLNAQANEAIEGVQDPFGYARRKIGILPSLALGAITGEDYFGREYTTAAEVMGVDKKGLYKTTELGKHYAGQEKGGRLAGQLTSYQSGATPGHLRPEQYPSFIASNLPIPFELQSWAEAIQGQTDGFDAMLQTLGFRTMAPSKKRQEEAGILEKPVTNFDSLFRQAVGR